MASSPVLNDIMETFRLPYLPDELSTIHIALFRDVQNSKAIRSALIAAATTEGPEGDLERDRYDFCFLEAKTVRSKCSFQSSVAFADARASAAPGLIQAAPHDRDSSGPSRCVQRRAGD